MMDTEMNVDIYLEFLRFALTDNSVVPDSVANINWQGLLRFTKEQAVVGIYARRILFSNDKLIRDVPLCRCREVYHEEGVRS